KSGEERIRRIRTAGKPGGGGSVGMAGSRVGADFPSLQVGGRFLWTNSPPAGIPRRCSRERRVGMRWRWLGGLVASVGWAAVALGQPIAPPAPPLVLPADPGPFPSGVPVSRPLQPVAVGDAPPDPAAPPPPPVAVDKAAP